MIGRTFSDGPLRATAINLALCLLLLPASRAGAGQAPKPKAAGASTRSPVARAGALTVSPAEVLREALLLRRDGRFDSMVKTSTIDGLDEIARAVIDRKLLASEARHRNIAREPGVVDLTARAIDLVLVETLLNRVKESVDAGDAAARRFYETEGDRFRTGVRRRVRHIVVATEQEAKDAQRELAAGRPFADVASVRNTDLTKKNGGDLGWVTPGTMVRDFDAAVFSLALGQVGGPVRTGMGYHVLMVEEIDPGTLPSFELVKEKVADAMKAHAVERLVATLRAANPVTINRGALDALLR